MLSFYILDSFVNSIKFEGKAIDAQQFRNEFIFQISHLVKLFLDSFFQFRLVSLITHVINKRYQIDPLTIFM